MINGGSCVHVLDMWSLTASSNQGGIYKLDLCNAPSPRWQINNWSHIDTHAYPIHMSKKRWSALIRGDGVAWDILSYEACDLAKSKPILERF